MIPGRLSHRREFTPVPSLSSVFAYMISPKEVMLGCLTPARVHPGCCTQSENLVPARDLAMACKREMTTRSGVKSASRWAGPGSACVHFLIDAIFAGWVYACILSICGVPSGKHDTNSPRRHVNAVSRSHPGASFLM